MDDPERNHEAILRESFLLEDDALASFSIQW
jgi:hypothetical protein